MVQANPEHEIRKIYEKKSIIYCLVDPRTKIIRYIGKSVNGLNRPKDNVRRGWKHHHKCGRWLLGLKSLGLTAEIEILEELSSPNEIDDAERFWIANFRAAGSALLNMTDGGEGMLKVVHSQTTRDLIGAKNSVSLLGNIPWNKGKSYSTPGTRANAANMRKFNQTESAKKKRADSLRGRKRPEAGKKIRAALLERGGSRIECINDGRVFNSAGQAAKHYGITDRTVRNVIDSTKPVKIGKGIGLRFRVVK